MLRRKLLIVLAILTVLMLTTAISSVLLIQSVLSDMEHINAIALTDTAATRRVTQTVETIAQELHDGNPDQQREINPFDQAMSQLNDELGELNELQALNGTTQHAQDHPTKLQEAYYDLETATIAFNARGDEPTNQRLDQPTQALNQMRQQILNHAELTFDQMKTAHIQATKRLRSTAITLAVIFVLLINISIILLLRVSSTILQPIDRLLEASRHLANEDYDYQIHIKRNDEFDDLAKAFNAMGKQLGANEKMKIETLHQVARTLNHELNNAIEIIELQLKMVTRSPNYDQRSNQPLERVHESLNHINETVATLTQVRRVVLTDYIKGVKMFDLKRSTQPDPPLAQNPSTRSQACKP